MKNNAAKEHTKWLKRLLAAVSAVVGLVVLVATMLAGIQLFSSGYEKDRNPAPGMLVDVGGRRMHVYLVGQGPTTFVLLSGGGVGAPMLEYRPLWSRLAEYGRVAVPEYLGYGWSDDTDRPRIAELIAEELRTALNEAGLTPPYTLVAHSLGGLYAMAYSQAHPEELAAIIALDTTLPQALFQAEARGESTPSLGPIALLRKAGVLRALLWLNPLLVSGAPEGVYSVEEARRIAMVTAWGYAGRAMVNEFLALKTNMSTLADFEFPRTLPVLFIHASSPDADPEIDGWSLAERRRLTHDLARGEVETLPAGHSGIYWRMSDDIVRKTLEFIGQSP